MRKHCDWNDFAGRTVNVKWCQDLGSCSLTAELTLGARARRFCAAIGGGRGVEC